METATNNKGYGKIIEENSGMFLRYQDLTTHLLLYFFIALEWIKGPLRNKESSYTTGMGLS